MASASSLRLAHTTVAAFWQAMAATAVPHDPAPITATLVGIPFTVSAALAAVRGRAPYTRRVDAVGAPVAVLVPVKSFSVAKRRLAPALDAAEREALARSMAEQVLRAAEPMPVAVVCDDGEVAGWATERGALVILAPGRGLNGAVADGVAHLAAQ